MPLLRRCELPMACSPAGQCTTQTALFSLQTWTGIQSAYGGYGQLPRFPQSFSQPLSDKHTHVLPLFSLSRSPSRLPALNVPHPSLSPISGSLPLSFSLSVLAFCLSNLVLEKRTHTDEASSVDIKQGNKSVKRENILYWKAECVCEREQEWGGAKAHQNSSFVSWKTGWSKK